MDTSAAVGIFKAYREGLSKKGSAGRGKNQPDFSVLLLHILLNRFPVRERLYVRRILDKSWQGVSAARKDQLEEAARLLAHGRETLGRPELSEEGHCLGVSMLESAQAYLDYKEERFDEARERTLIAMDADLTLEQDEDYDLLEMHRIQAAHNLMRIDLRAGFPERGFALAGYILTYLEGWTDELPVHGSWQRETLQRIPQWNRRAMVAQVANEAAVGLHRWPEPVSWGAFYSSYSDDTPGLHPRIQQWIQMKEAFGKSDWISYLSILAEFLREGRGDISPIWYASLIDFLSFCDQVGSRPARQVRDKMLQDSVKWPSLPAALRSCLFRFEGTAGT